MNNNTRFSLHVRRAPFFVQGSDSRKRGLFRRCQEQVLIFLIFFALFFFLKLNLVRHEVRPELVEANDVPLLVEAVAMPSGSGSTKGRLVLSLEQLSFFPDDKAAPKLRFRRKEVAAVAATGEDAVLTVKAKEHMIRFVFLSVQVAKTFRDSLSERSEPKAQPTARQVDLQNRSLCSPSSPVLVGLLTQKKKSTAFGSLMLTCLQAENLLGMDSSGKSDPFVRATLQFRTAGKEKEKEHVRGWCSVFVFCSLWLLLQRTTRRCRPNTWSNR